MKRIILFNCTFFSGSEKVFFCGFLVGKKSLKLNECFSQAVVCIFELLEKRGGMKEDCTAIEDGLLLSVTFLGCRYLNVQQHIMRLLAREDCLIEMSSAQSPF